jgi:hypothetical protein
MRALVISGSMGSGKTTMMTFSAANDGTRRATEVALEILQRAGWVEP